MTTETLQTDRHCLRAPIPEVLDVARYLDAAVSAHIAGNLGLAGALIRQADIPSVRQWLDSIWGSKSPYVMYRAIANSPPTLPDDARVGARMPPESVKRELIKRDGYHCRFCGIPVIRSEIRDRVRQIYPDQLQWGNSNATQHAGFQALWLQYDHLLPHSRGGQSVVENMIITCAACNFGRMQFTLEEVGLSDPRNRQPVTSLWDGLERFT